MDALRGYSDSSDLEQSELSVQKLEGAAIEKEAAKILALGHTIDPTLVVRGRDRVQKPEETLLTLAPADAQRALPLHGPLKPKAEHEWDLYRHRRNQDLGHIIRKDNESAVLPALHEELWNAQRVRDAKEVESKRRKVDKELSLPELTDDRVSLKDPASEEFLGPWAPFKGEEAREKRFKEIMEANADELESEQAAKKLSSGRVQASRNVISEAEQFVFHGSSTTDYQGRSWIAGPIAVEADVEHCTFPKAVLHTYLGHRKPVLRQQFIPGSQHLLLSCSMDQTCKIWSVFNSRECLATYTGHTKGVKDVSFTHDGSRFYSCSMDTKIIEWDTETGKQICTMGNGKLPFSLCVHPNESHILVCGHQNKVAVQYDARSGEITQEYNEHLAAVNTATFCDQGRKLVTTSDDKRMFIWEFGINVVMKHIAEPYMSSMPAVTLDPRGEYLACQSMDNQIVLYEAVHRFRLQSRRRFKGHTSSGYAIKPGFSPDSRFLASGDTTGHLWLWDYATSKVVRSCQNSGHTGPIMSVAWNKKSPSLLATAGWDGNIKLWD